MRSASIVAPGSTVSVWQMFGYAPHGGMASLLRGDGLTESWTYNSRMQASSISVGTWASPTSALGLNLYYCPDKALSCGTNNGNLEVISLAVPGVDQKFKYDDANRLIAAAEQPSADMTALVNDTNCTTAGFASGWWQRNCYDAYGNRWVNPASYLPNSTFTPVSSSNYPDGQNHAFVNVPAGVTDPYDSAGNLAAIGGYALKYDAENRLVQANFNNGATPVSSTGYTYDGDGRRVQKIACPAGTSACTSAVAGAAVTNYVYDASGKLAAEYVLSGTPPAAPCTTCYLSVDHLGSTRVLTDGATGSVVERHDFLPFGEELYAGVGGRTTGLKYLTSLEPLSVRPRFTGKERDAETGLDYFGARYMSAAQGRFTSPDNPKFSGKTSPQTWNLYSYTANNPLSAVDLTGNNWFKINGNWSWHDGSDVDDNGDPCKKGSEGCNHSDYTMLLRIQKTGKYAKDGAEIEKLTLLGAGENDVLAAGTGYTGKLGTYMTTPNGDYEINLNRRGGLQSQYFLQVPQGYVLGPYPGIQRVGPVTIRDQVFDARNDWGDYRADLIGPNGPTPFYLHGKQDYFDYGRTYTHGCTTEPLQRVLKAVFRLDPNGVGDGEKNGRLLVNVSGK